MNPDVMTLAEIVERGLRDGEGVRVIGPSGVVGRTTYREVGKMWRERSDLSHYVSPDGEYHKRRYLPHETLIVISRGAP
jgi:dihydrofolate reductase